MIFFFVQGCHQLVKAGADGVIQAMVLSFAGLVFKQQHLELNSHPKDLHRDYFFRRVGYGNATHLNISIIVRNDNKAVIKVASDRQDKDYFACDAGCLDPPVQLTTGSAVFPGKDMSLRFRVKKLLLILLFQSSLRTQSRQFCTSLRIINICKN